VLSGAKACYSLNWSPLARFACDSFTATVVATNLQLLFICEFTFGFIV
jgi:hypothetical protein